MQKFGLNVQRNQQLTLLETELVKEQASALGRAGRSLRVSLERYNQLLEKSANQSALNTQLEKISQRVWALVLQREFLGFTENNIEWIREHYLIPDQAIAALGKTTSR
jgi:hypothetical protein